MWIKISDRLPKTGVFVLTFHFLNRISMQKFDGKFFNDPITCPVTKDGTPIGWTSRIPMEAITHWMPLPAPPTADNVEGANLQPPTHAAENGEAPLPAGA